MNFITPMVAVGDMGDALDGNALKNVGIKAVLSLAPVNLHGAVEHHLQLEVADRVPLPFDVITTALAFVDRCVQSGHRLLLHCEMGISRSPSLAVCYLHRSQGMSLDDAIRYVQSVRPKAEPHPELMKSIRDYFSQRQL